MHTAHRDAAYVHCKRSAPARSHAAEETECTVESGKSGGGAPGFFEGECSGRGCSASGPSAQHVTVKLKLVTCTTL